MARRTPDTAYLKESASTLRGGGTMDELIRGWRDELTGFEKETDKLGADKVAAAREALDEVCDSAAAFQRATIDNYDEARRDLEQKWSRVERVFSVNRGLVSGRAWPLI